MIYSCTVKPVYRHQKDKPILSNSILKVSTCEQLYTSDFKIQRRGRQRERQKTIGLISKTTTFHVHHACLHISLPFLHDYNMKMPNFAFYGVHKQATTKFSFSFCTWIWSLGIQLQEG